jgi:hypothetical protein
MEELSEHSKSPRGDNAKGNIVDELMHGRPRRTIKRPMSSQDNFSLDGRRARRIESPARNYCEMIIGKNFGPRAVRR